MALHSDLQHILKYTQTLWPSLKNSRIFITGGTGFIGKWLLESFIAANECFSLNAQIVVLTRNCNNFRQECPRLANHNSITLYQGDVRNFLFPSGNFTHVIHGAIDVSMKQSPLTIFEVITEGTKRVLDFCLHSQIKNFLLISSGAVYGRQPPEMKYIDEKYGGAPALDSHHTAYGHGKRIAEWFATIYNADYRLQCRIARCFAFIGPYLSLTGSFAVGNFIGNLIRGESIKVQGDGTPIRSYLYAADMAIWLWTILICGKSGMPYNVGSEEEMSIHEVASKVSQLSSPASEVQILTPYTEHNKLPERYVPSTKLAREDLGLQVKISVNEALSRMVQWAHSNQR